MNPQAIRNTLAVVLVILCALPAPDAPAYAQFAPLFMPNANQAPRPEPAERWRLEFHDAADSDGIISFRLWVQEESPMHVDVPIRKGESDREIARAARDALANRLGERYAAVVVDGEDVVITAQRGSPRFTVELLRDTARDVDVDVDRD
jgi:hypothetical protein